MNAWRDRISTLKSATILLSEFGRRIDALLHFDERKERRAATPSRRIRNHAFCCPCWSAFRCPAICSRSVLLGRAIAPPRSRTHCSERIQGDDRPFITRDRSRTDGGYEGKGVKSWSSNANRKRSGECCGHNSDSPDSLTRPRLLRSSTLLTGDNVNSAHLQLAYLTVGQSKEVVRPSGL
jgi:hypothetical protein